MYGGDRVRPCVLLLSAVARADDRFRRPVGPTVDECFGDIAIVTIRLRVSRAALSDLPSSSRHRARQAGRVRRAHD